MFDPDPHLISRISISRPPPDLPRSRRSGLWKRALELLSEMQSLGIEPQLATVNAAISACQKAGQPEQAVVLLERMQVDHRQEGRLDGHLRCLRSRIECDCGP